MKNWQGILSLLGLLLLFILASSFSYAMSYHWTVRFIPISEWGCYTMVRDGPSQVVTIKKPVKYLKYYSRRIWQ